MLEFLVEKWEPGRKLMTLNDRNPNVCLITYPLPKSISGIHVLVENFLYILDPLVEEIYLITGNYPQNAVFSPKINLININYNNNYSSILLRILKMATVQLKLSYYLTKNINKVKVVIFFIGTSLVLPMIVAKLFDKPIVLIATGSAAAGTHHTYRESLGNLGMRIIYKILRIMEVSGYVFSDKIVVLSDRLIYDLGISRYYKKIEFNCAIFIDINLFKNRSIMQKKKNKIGYVGRLTESKGARNFVQAIPLVSLDYNAHFLIIGDGPLLEELKDEVKSKGLEDTVVFTGWISHEKLPYYLNELKLLVVPSYTEVFATSALEAMACNTPALVNPVGSAPDIIKDGQNGFFMENNSPKCIAENIERVLDYPDLENVGKNARTLIETEFSYHAVMERYKDIIRNVGYK